VRKPLPIEEMPLPLVSWREDDPAPPLDRVTGDVGRLLCEIAELRLAAEEVTRAESKRIEKLLLQILDVIDAFERVFKAVQAKEQQVTKQMRIWLGNFRTVRRLLDNILDEYGVTPIQNIDRGFDPTWHKAVETRADASRTDGTIVEEILRGYLRGPGILRKSEVVVIKNDE